MYSFKISPKYIYIYIGQFIGFALLFIIAFIVSLGMANSFKKSVGMADIEFGFTSMKEEYANYENDYGLAPSNDGNILYHFYDESGEPFVKDAKTAQQFIDFNLEIDNILTSLALFSIIQLVLVATVTVMAGVKRRGIMFGIVGCVSCIFKFLVTFGVSVWLYVVGFIIDIIAIILVSRDLKKIKIDNERILRRKELYNSRL